MNEWDYNKLARICLYADGGMCQNCANDVAEGFSKEYPEIDLEKLKNIINEIMDKYYKSDYKEGRIYR